MSGVIVEGRSVVTVHVPKDVSFDLKKMQRVTANILGKLGCEGCHSGRVLQFITMENFVVNAQTLEVQEVAGPGVIG